jgi:hypothetical protein
MPLSNIRIIHQEQDFRALENYHGVDVQNGVAGSLNLLAGLG